MMVLRDFIRRYGAYAGELPLSVLIDKFGAEEGRLEKLEELLLDENATTDGGLTELGKLKSLKKLTLRGCEDVSDTGLVELESLQNLLWLDVTGTNVTQAGIERLYSKIPDCHVVWRNRR